MTAIKHEQCRRLGSHKQAATMPFERPFNQGAAKTLRAIFCCSTSDINIRVWKLFGNYAIARKSYRAASVHVSHHRDVIKILFRTKAYAPRTQATFFVFEPDRNSALKAFGFFAKMLARVKTQILFKIGLRILSWKCCLGFSRQYSARTALHSERNPALLSKRWKNAICSKNLRLCWHY